MLKSRISILIIIFIGFYGKSFAQFSDKQLHKIDSLNAVIQHSDQDTAIASAYYELSDILYIVNLDTILYLCEKATIIAQSNLEKECSEKEKVSFLKTKASALNNIGYVYKSHGDIPKALDFYHASLLINEEIKDKSGTANLLNNIAVIYESQNDSKQALEYYEKALQLFRETNFKPGIAASLNNIGVIYRNEKASGKKALDYYLEALAIRKEIGNKIGISNSLNNIGYVYDRLNDREKALDYHKQALKIREEIGYKKGIISSLFNIGDLKFNAGNVSEAKQYATKAIKIAQSAGIPSEIRKVSFLLKEIYHKEGNAALELEMYELYIKMRDSLDNKKNNAAVYKQQLQYKFEKQKAIDSKEAEKQLAIADQKKQQQKTITFIISVCLFLVIIFSIFIYKRWRLTQQQQVTILSQRDELDRKNEEKKFMMKEIHHRVKNNLQVVNSLLRLQSYQIKDEKIVAIFEECQNRILSMSRLHEKMYSSEDLINIDIEEHFSSLLEDLIKDYGISTKITRDINIKNVNLGIKTLVPLGLLINEITSNALKHAFTGKPDGTITVHLKKIDSTTHELTIGDNGIGIKNENIQEPKSLGLELIHAFTEQLDGSIEQLDAPGVMYKITFKKVD